MSSASASASDLTAAASRRACSRIWAACALASSSTSAACSSARRSISLAAVPSPAYVGFSFSSTLVRSESTSACSDFSRLWASVRLAIRPAFSAVVVRTSRSTAAVS